MSLNIFVGALLDIEGALLDIAALNVLNVSKCLMLDHRGNSIDTALKWSLACVVLVRKEDSLFTQTKKEGELLVGIQKNTVDSL